MGDNILMSDRVDGIDIPKQTLGLEVLKGWEAWRYHVEEDTLIVDNSS